MLHAGLSLFAFKKWASNPKNMVILPGYCVPGTVGAKVLKGDKRIEVESGVHIDVNLAVENLSFSAHADAKGIMQLIRQCDAKNVVLVHGEKKKMGFLAGRIKKELGVDCYYPANGQCLDIETQSPVPVMISRGLLHKRQRDDGGSVGAGGGGGGGGSNSGGGGSGGGFESGLDAADGDSKSKRVATNPDGSRNIEGVLVIKESAGLKLVDASEAATELGLGQHMLEFRSIVNLPLSPDTPASVAIEFVRTTISEQMPEVAGAVKMTDAEMLVRTVAVRCKAPAKLEVSWQYTDDALANRMIHLLEATLASVISAD